MSVAATAWAWAQSAESSGQKLVLLALADAAGGDQDDARVCWPSGQRIADMTGTGVQNVRKHIDRLVEMGLLVKLRRRKRSNGQLGTWRYAVMFTSDTPVALDTVTSDTPVAVKSAHPVALDQCAPSSTQEPSVVLEPSLEPSLTPTHRIFDVWVATLGRKRSLTEERRKLIAKQLKVWPEEDLADAVRGWVNDPWPDRVNQNDLLILLRDAAHIEKFRDLYRDGAPMSRQPNLRNGERAIARILAHSEPIDTTGRIV